MLSIQWLPNVPVCSPVASCSVGLCSVEVKRLQNYSRLPYLGKLQLPNSIHVEMSANCCVGVHVLPTWLPAYYLHSTSAEGVNLSVSLVVCAFCKLCSVLCHENVWILSMKTCYLKVVMN